MKVFHELSPEVIIELQNWARKNYHPFHEINGLWHPIVIRECASINEEMNRKCRVYEAEELAERDKFLGTHMQDNKGSQDL